MFMPVSVSLQLDKRRAKRDGSYPIKVLVVRDTQPLRIATGYSVEEKHWNPNGQTIKSVCKAYPNVTRVNNLLQKQRSNVSDKITQLQDENKLQRLSLQELKQFLINKQAEAIVLSFGEEIIKELKGAGKLGNARVYDTMLRSVRTYLNRKDRPLKQLTYTWLKKYEVWYLGRGNSINGLSVNMRTLRALFNRAIERNLVSKDYYSFTQYSIKKEATRKRAISREDIEKIKEFQHTTIRQERAKDYFLMSFYLMGASFIDLAFLQMKNIQNNRIEYKRRKTGRLHSIK
ncbi:MAG: site-specific integrase, partial [Pseudomonadota bacterium]